MPASGPDDAAPNASSAYAWYVLFVLFLANAFNAVDRAMVNILVESIRAEFHFSDAEIGALSGLGFALFYAGLGVPIARWADRGNRKAILAIGIAVWSGMTALTGRATGFFTFLAARAGVGIGEASCFPTAYPLIGDYFTRHRRPLAMALFQMGLFVGIVAGNIIAAQIAAHHGWRTAFAAIGLPGLALALLVFVTVREPPRGRYDALSPGMTRMTFGGAVRLLARDRRFLTVVAGSTALTFASATLGSWGPAFMMRIHGVSQANVGFVAAPIGLGGVLGTVLGGVIGSALSKRRGEDRAPLLVPIWLTLLAVPAILVFIFAESMPLVVAGGAIGSFAIAAHTGPALAVALSLVRPDMRGLASSVVVIGHLLIGFGLGPLIVGALSDAFSSSAGEGSLRLALGIVPAILLLGWVALRVAYRWIGDLRSDVPIAGVS